MPEYAYPEALKELIELLKSLPGIGRRTAERLSLAVLKWPPEKIEYLGELLKSFPEKISFCSECGNLAGAEGVCSICKSPGRDESIICVVEEADQIISIENSSIFKGRYHVLRGKLSPLSGVNADDLNIDSLLEKVGKGDVREIIFALSPDVEGQATASYIADLIKDKEIKITRLAQGLPAGSDISYADAATIAVALNGRTPV